MTDTTETTGRGAFRGWPADGLAFLAELEQDNTRGFWMAHMHRYRDAVLEPTRALAAALSRGVRAAAGVPPARRPAVPARGRAVPHRHRGDRLRAGRHPVRGAALHTWPGGADRPPAVRRRPAAPVPGGGRRPAGGGAGGRAGRAARRGPGARRRAGLAHPAPTLPARPPPPARSCACAACTSTARGRRATGSRRGRRWTGCARRGGRRGRWPTGWTRTSAGGRSGPAGRDRRAGRRSPSSRIGARAPIEATADHRERSTATLPPTAVDSVDARGPRRTPAAGPGAR